MAEPDLNAFVPGGRLSVEATGQGRLSGLRFAAKDLIDVAGMVTAAGNPDWAAAQRPARRHAPVVQKLLAAGATFGGKTITDELAFSLEGVNDHYGTPVNPAMPNCLPGGSSSGSAAAVAGGLSDFALGTDTGGSVRVPGAFCRIFAMRPSHGRVDISGVTPFAPSYDTLGWFARDAATLSSVGSVLLGQDASHTPIADIRLAKDALSLAEKPLASAIEFLSEQIVTGPAVNAFAAGWEDYYTAYDILQARDIREALGAELARIRPDFGPEIARRFSAALHRSANTADAEDLRLRAKQYLTDLLAPGQALLLPTSPVSGLSRNCTADDLSHFYPRALALGAIAGHAGAPQIQIPASAASFSLLAAPGCDMALLDCAERISAYMQG